MLVRGSGNWHNCTKPSTFRQYQCSEFNRGIRTLVPISIQCWFLLWDSILDILNKIIPTSYVIYNLLNLSYLAIHALGMSWHWRRLWSSDSLSLVIYKWWVSCWLEGGHCRWLKGLSLASLSIDWCAASSLSYTLFKNRNPFSGSHSHLLWHLKSAQFRSLENPGFIKWILPKCCAEEAVCHKRWQD